MFGFLKQKIADFGSKLKHTISKEETKDDAKIPQEEKTTKPQTKKVETKQVEKKEEKAQPIETKQVETAPIKKAQPKQVQTETKQTKPIEQVEAKSPEKKPGLLGKLFEIGKKKTEEEKPKEEKKKKTKEELAEEMEAKMFAKIEEEVKKEEKVKKLQTPTPEFDETPAQMPAEIVTPEVKTKASEILAEIEEKSKEIEEEKELEEEEPEEEVVQEKEPVKEYAPKPRDIQIKTIEEDKRELKAKVGVAGGLKGLLFGGVEITEKQIEELLWELELSLIESDVEQDAARELIKQIKQKLIGTKVSAKNIDEYLKEEIKEILSEMMKTEKINLLTETETHKPLKILMIGPNGAGKTTSIAKLVNYFQKNKKSCVVAAADTFRAGAIDQLEVHANKLRVRVIKQQYGADPAAVVFDAVKAAEAGKIDVVLIDSAGRQETNKNLMEELRKIERVAKPDLKIYVGEAYVGQTLLDQVEEFKQIVGIDAFILTKIDTDAKGGTAISLLYKMKKPILFVGTGQGYDDFEEFTPEFVLDRII